jgi:glycosyltransferase involved in cell wall biosynthesis
MKLFIVIPAYNEQDRIGDVIEKTKRFGYPIIIVDDGSTDNTYYVSKKAGADYVLRHKINLGNSKGAALKTGCLAAFRLGADAVVLMDSDGQHDPDDLSKFVERLQNKKCGIVFGIRSLGKDTPTVRRVGNKLASFIVHLLFGIYLEDLICGYRAMTKRAFEKIDWKSIDYAVETEMVVKTGQLGLKYCQVPVKTIYLDSVKGVTVLDAAKVLFDVVGWRLKL